LNASEFGLAPQNREVWIIIIHYHKETTAWFFQKLKRSRRKPAFKRLFGQRKRFWILDELIIILDEQKLKFQDYCRSQKQNHSKSRSKTRKQNTCQESINNQNLLNRRCSSSLPSPRIIRKTDLALTKKKRCVRTSFRNAIKLWGFRKN
jgi:hypothetical protein